MVQATRRTEPCASHLLLAFSLIPAAAECQAQAPDLRFEHLTVDDGLPSNWISAVYQDRLGFMWFGTNEGLCRYDGYACTVYRHDPNDPNSLSTDGVVALLEDQDGMIWIGHDGGGLSRFDPASETFTQYRHDEADPRSLSNDHIQALYQDRQGILWVGTPRGLSRVDRTVRFFTTYPAASLTPSGLRGIPVGLFLDRDDVLWIGTRGRWLTRLDRRTGRYTHYRPSPVDSTGLAPGYITTIHRDRRGRLWVGTAGNGLSRFDEATGRFIHYLHDPEDATSLSGNAIWSLCEDRAGRLWVGTFVGLDRFNEEAGTFTRYVHAPDEVVAATDMDRDDVVSIDKNGVSTLYEDRAGRLWVGMPGGLKRFDTESEAFTHYPYGPSDPSGLNKTLARDLYERSQEPGVLWVGTDFGGLHRLDVPSGRVTHHYTSQNSDLPSNRIWSVLGDEQGYLWLSSKSGLARFDPDQEQFEVFGPEDGLQSFELGAFQVG